MTVQARSHRALSTRADVAVAVAGATGPVLDIQEFALDDVSTFDEETGERRLSVPVTIGTGAPRDDQLDLLEPGVHPITIQIRRDNALIASSTTFVDVVRADGPGRGPFTFEVLAGVDDRGPLPTEADDARAATAIAEVVALVAAVDLPVTVALPPTYLDTVLADGDLASSLRAALGGDDRLLVLPDQPLDPSAAAAVDLQQELVDRFSAGEAALARRFPETPLIRGAWLVDRDITAGGATAIHDLGIPLLIVPYDHYVTLGNSLPSFTDPSLRLTASLADDSTMSLMVVDPITELLAPDDDPDSSAIERAVHLMADTSALRYQLDPDVRSMVLATQSLGVPDVDVLRELSVLVAQHPDYEFADIGRIPDVTNSFFVDGAELALRLDARPDINLAARFRRIQETRLQAADVASMLPSADGRPDAWGTSMRTALSTGLSADEAVRMMETIDTDLKRIRGQIEPPDPFPFTIGGTTTEIPLRIGNNGPTPLRILVHAESDKLRFPDGDVEVLLAPDQINMIDIAVEARSNGVFPVEVELLTPAGNRLAGPVVLTARVSTLTGLGRAVTVGALLVLATWWFSYFRRRRSVRRTADLEAALDRHPAAGADGERAADGAGPTPG